jgi:hypothetical protein
MTPSVEALVGIANDVTRRIKDGHIAAPCLLTWFPTLVLMLGRTAPGVAPGSDRDAMGGLLADPTASLASAQSEDGLPQVCSLSTTIKNATGPSGSGNALVTEEAREAAAIHLIRVACSSDLALWDEDDVLAAVQEPTKLSAILPEELPPDTRVLDRTMPPPTLGHLTYGLRLEPLQLWKAEMLGQANAVMGFGLGLEAVHGTIVSDHAAPRPHPHAPVPAESVRERDQMSRARIASVLVPQLPHGPVIMHGLAVDWAGGPASAMSALRALCAPSEQLLPVPDIRAPSLFIAERSLPGDALERELLLPRRWDMPEFSLDSGVAGHLPLAPAGGGRGYDVTGVEYEYRKGGKARGRGLVSPYLSPRGSMGAGPPTVRARLMPRPGDDSLGEQSDEALQIDDGDYSLDEHGDDTATELEDRGQYEYEDGGMLTIVTDRTRLSQQLNCVRESDDVRSAVRLVHERLRSLRVMLGEHCPPYLEPLLSDSAALVSPVSRQRLQAQVSGINAALEALKAALLGPRLSVDEVAQIMLAVRYNSGLFHLSSAILPSDQDSIVAALTEGGDDSIVSLAGYSLDPHEAMDEQKLPGAFENQVTYPQLLLGFTPPVGSPRSYLHTGRGR